jgi:hypothetical protein
MTRRTKVILGCIAGTLLSGVGFCVYVAYEQFTS